MTIEHVSLSRQRTVLVLAEAPPTFRHSLRVCFRCKSAVQLRVGHRFLVLADFSFERQGSLTLNRVSSVSVYCLGVRQRFVGYQRKPWHSFILESCSRSLKMSVSFAMIELYAFSSKDSQQQSECIGHHRSVMSYSKSDPSYLFQLIFFVAS